MDLAFAFSNALTQALGPTMIVYALAAIGLNVHFGYTGLLNFGQAALVGVASYGMAMTVATFGFRLWVGVLVGLASTLVLALLMGIPTLRLRADYLAIVTIAAAEIVRRLYRSVTLSEYTGGSDGLRGFSQDFFALNPFPQGYRAEWGWGPLKVAYSGRDLWVMIVGWALVALSLLVVWLVMKSPWGRVLKAIREDEDAVRSLGKNVFSFKLQSLVLGGLIGALGGFIFALSRSNVQPDNYHTDFTFYAYAIVILGGAARVFGPLVGAAIFWFLITFFSRLLEQVAAQKILPASILTINDVGPIVFIMVGLGMILMLIFRPQGIFGDKREISLDVR